jgi:hypothetical protein
VQFCEVNQKACSFLLSKREDVARLAGNVNGAADQSTSSNNGQNPAYPSSRSARQLVRSLLEDQTKNNYSILKNHFSPSTTYGLYKGDKQVSYLIGDPLGGTTTSGDNYPWSANNQQFDFIFSGQNSYATNQNYHFKAPDTNGLGGGHWNLTENTNSNVLRNRALGNVITNLVNKTNKNQGSHLSAAEEINSSYLLGIQSLNVISNRDTNTTRPQLNVTFMRNGDLMDQNNQAIPSDDSSINGKIARTGQEDL